MLEVQIAEVSKSLLDKLEVGATLRYAAGSWATTLLSNFLSGSTGGLLDARKSNGNQLTLAAQKQDGLVRILAEPTVMAISGQEGSFLAGGKIYIPVGQDNGKVTLEEKEFGVGLRFTPTVLAGGRINLKVAPEVSEVAREGIGISAAGLTGGAVLPLITTRRAATTVQLFDGQSFAIGGLIKSNQISNIKGLPLLGEVPVLGALFRSTDFQHDRSELLFVITAHLVKPLPPNYALPTDQLGAPGRAELFLGGRMEGAAPAPAAGAAAAAAGGGRLRIAVNQTGASMHTPRHRAFRRPGRPALAAALLALLLGGCAPTTPQLDRRAGDAVRVAFAQQVAHPGAGANPDPVAGIDGKSARAALERYQKSFAEPASPAASFTIGGGK